MAKEQQIEQNLIARLKDLKYTYREHIRDREALERIFAHIIQSLFEIEKNNGLMQPLFPSADNVPG